MSNIPSLNGIEPPGVINPGLYLAKIELANQKVSKSGNDMLEVGLSLTGTGDMIYEYFVYEQDFALRRLLELVLACGLSAQGEFPTTELEDCKVGVDITLTGDDNFPTKVSKFISVDDADAVWLNGDVEDEDDPVPF